MLHQSKILAGLALAMGGALMLPLKPIVAAPLTDAECAQLKDEQLRLGALGVRAAMLRGPDWAKSNADPAMLNNIARLIEVEEGIAFRCPLPKPVAATTEDDEDGAAAPAAKKPAPKAAAKTGSANEAANVAPKAPFKAQPKPSEPKTTQTKTGPAKAAQPKPKVNDAYVPPPKSPAWDAGHPATSKQ